MRKASDIMLKLLKMEPENNKNRRKLTMKRTSKLILTAVTAALTVIGCYTFLTVNSSFGNDKLQLRLAHGQAGNSEIGGTIAYLSDLVAEDESKGMEVSVYPGGVLGSETAMIELVQAGILDMAKISANTLGQFDDRYTIFSLPYLFVSQEHYYSAMANSELVRELFNATEDAGYIAIGYYCNGSRNFYLKDNVAVTDPSVLKGKKIRSMVSSTSMDMIEAMGGSPVPMSSSETYTSLQQGIVDGAENTELALTVDKHEEIVRSYTYTEHQYTPDIYIISTKTWNKLTQDQKDYLLNCFVKLNDNFVEKYNGMMDDAIAEAESYGVTVYRDIDKTAFIEAVQPIHENFLAKGEAYQALYEDIQKYAQEGK
jgi:tripartite ATP-independent transporter DctP family solute receptor